MTTVYGVTRYGAKYQILRQLKYIDEFPREHAWAASVYLTEKTFYCLREMFSATKEIQVRKNSLCDTTRPFDCMVTRTFNVYRPNYQ
jgi:DNA-directed RNA polymerase